MPDSTHACLLVMYTQTSTAYAYPFSVNTPFPARLHVVVGAFFRPFFAAYSHFFAPYARLSVVYKGPVIAYEGPVIAYEGPVIAYARPTVLRFFCDLVTL